MERYEIKQYMSRGAQAETFVANDRETGQLVLLKISKRAGMSELQVGMMLSEARIQAQINSEFVVKVLGSFETPEQIVTVLEFAPYGDLESQLQKREGEFFHHSQITTWVMQLLLALDAIHSNRTMHRDLKLSNIVMKPDQRFPNPKALLCDFGVAKVGDEMSRTTVGTPHYMSPQVCKGHTYSQKTDIFSLGVALYRLMTFRYPFEGGNIMQVKASICSQNYKKIENPDYPAELTQLCYDMLAHDEVSRPGARELLRRPIFQTRLDFYHIQVPADPEDPEDFATVVGPEIPVQ